MIESQSTESALSFPAPTPNRRSPQTDQQKHSRTDVDVQTGGRIRLVENRWHAGDVGQHVEHEVCELARARMCECDDVVHLASLVDGASGTARPQAPCPPNGLLLLVCVYGGERMSVPSPVNRSA
jgi:hypothetical protein